MAEVTARLPYVCRPFSCLDERTVDGASGPQCVELPVKQHCTGCRRTAGAPSRNHYSTHYTPFLGKLLRNMGCLTLCRRVFPNSADNKALFFSYLLQPLRHRRNAYSFDIVIVL